jgi:hypothetical protein
MELLKEGDTVYIPLSKLQGGFIDRFLPLVTVPVVIISGQVHLLKKAVQCQCAGTPPHVDCLVLPQPRH